MSYCMHHVRPEIDDPHNVISCKNSEATMVGVYFVAEDGTSEWVADFLSEDDAHLFLRAKDPTWA